jgi:hypothetical protein
MTIESVSPTNYNFLEELSAEDLFEIDPLELTTSREYTPSRESDLESQTSEAAASIFRTLSTYEQFKEGDTPTIPEPLFFEDFDFNDFEIPDYDGDIEEEFVRDFSPALTSSEEAVENPGVALAMPAATVSEELPKMKRKRTYSLEALKRRRDRYNARKPPPKSDSLKNKLTKIAAVPKKERKQNPICAIFRDLLAKKKEEELVRFTPSSHLFLSSNQHPNLTNARFPDHTISEAKGFSERSE